MIARRRYLIRVLRQGLVIAQRYRLDKEIAAGATGRVWRATDEQSRQQVAIKMLRRDYARSPATLDRFWEAARRTAAVSHEGVARVCGYGEGGPSGAPYLVTELIEGPSLPAVISGEGTRGSVIATILGQVADALHAAHLAGLAHGDLKPANILLRAWPERRAAVTDFGIAHAVGAVPRAGDTPETVHGTGTALYLAPERVRGEPGTPASDLYSLGIVAHEWLTGAPPFTGTPREVMAAHRREPRPGLPAVVPPALAELVTRLTARDLAERYEDASLVAAVARAVARELRAEEDGSVLFPPAAAQDAAGLPASPGEAPAGDVEAEPVRNTPGGAGRLSRMGTGKREVIWAASALLLGGVVGWAAWGPVQAAVKAARLAVAPVASPGRVTGQHPATASGRDASGTGGSRPAGHPGGPARATSRATGPGPGQAGRRRGGPADRGTGPGDGTAAGSGGPGVSPSAPGTPSAAASARRNVGSPPAAGPVPGVPSQSPAGAPASGPTTPAMAPSLPPWIAIPFTPATAAPLRPPYRMTFPFQPVPGLLLPEYGSPGPADPPWLPGPPRLGRHFVVPISVPGL
jgi:hypothetical protein